MSTVWYKDARETSPSESQPEVIRSYLRDMLGSIDEGSLVAVKLHPGEYGNTTHVRPAVIRAVVDVLKGMGARPFLTESTTLYGGGRFNGADLIETASANGFNLASMRAPFVVADGLRGDDGVSVHVGGAEIKDIEVASACAKCDYMVVVSHDKGHPTTGYGGAVKHLGMGCLTKAGKRKVHEVCIPRIDQDICTSCRRCIQECPWDAISIDPESKKAVIDPERCAGALSCMEVCTFGAILEPEGSRERMQLRLGEAAVAPIKALNERIFYINWAYELTAGCDCFSYSDLPFTEHVGMLFSHDPVALDRATLDLINQRSFLHDYSDANLKKEKMSCVWDISPYIHLESAERLGAGRNSYRLEEIVP